MLPAVNHQIRNKPIIILKVDMIWYVCRLWDMVYIHSRDCFISFLLWRDILLS